MVSLSSPFSWQMLAGKSEREYYSGNNTNKYLEKAKYNHLITIIFLRLHGNIGVKYKMQNLNMLSWEGW